MESSKPESQKELHELLLLYDNIAFEVADNGGLDEETQKWMLDNMWLWFGKKKPL